MSLCDVCLNPGACCRDFIVSSFGGETGKARPQEPMSLEKAEHLVLSMGLPFTPSRQQDGGIWRFSCLALQHDGRCGIYEDRPGLCRSYVAGSDGLCAHYWPDPERERPHDPAAPPPH